MLGSSTSPAQAAAAGVVVGGALLPLALGPSGFGSAAGTDPAMALLQVASTVPFALSFAVPPLM